MASVQSIDGKYYNISIRRMNTSDSITVEKILADNERWSKDIKLDHLIEKIRQKNYSVGKCSDSRLNGDHLGFDAPTGRTAGGNNIHTPKRFHIATAHKSCGAEHLAEEYHAGNVTDPNFIALAETVDPDSVKNAMQALQSTISNTHYGLSGVIDVKDGRINFISLLSGSYKMNAITELRDSAIKLNSDFALYYTGFDSRGTDLSKKQDPRIVALNLNVLTLGQLTGIEGIFNQPGEVYEVKEYVAGIPIPEYKASAVALGSLKYPANSNLTGHGFTHLELFPIIFGHTSKGFFGTDSDAAHLEVLVSDLVKRDRDIAELYAKNEVPLVGISVNNDGKMREEVYKVEVKRS